MTFFMGGSTYVVPTPHQDHNKLNPSYNEILKLNTMLDDAKIPHMMRRLDDGWHQRTQAYRTLWKGLV